MHYVDTSALVKLVVDEQHSADLRSWLEQDPAVITSDLTRTELTRAVMRVHPARAQRVPVVLRALDAMALSRRTLDEAGRLAPPALRSLDAIHLAAALALGDDLESLVTYDDRLADAARLAGVSVLSPGR